MQEDSYRIAGALSMHFRTHEADSGMKDQQDVQPSEPALSRQDTEGSILE